MCAGSWQPRRRDFLARMGIGGLMLTPMAAAMSLSLGGCKKGNWPDGMVEIK